MEKRFYLGLGLLTLFLVLGLVTAIAIRNASMPVSQKLEQASQAVLSGNLDAGISLAQQAKKDWDTAWSGVAMVADHSPMDEIDSLFAQMEVYARAGNRLDFGAYCARLSELVKAIADAESFNWRNLL